MSLQQNENSNPAPLLALGSLIHCNGCGQAVGHLCPAGLTFLTGHVLRFPLTLQCTCGRNIRLGRRFEENRRRQEDGGHM